MCVDLCGFQRGQAGFSKRPTSNTPNHQLQAPPSRSSVQAARGPHLGGPHSGGPHLDSAYAEHAAHGAIDIVAMPKPTRAQLDVIATRI